uniref:Uncharacterized protein n=1 Tax=Amphora coffeiformis TaxID=265554 RepID=A0A7S3KZA5_9STRA|eukprot:scaffold15108_cov180-Amphora_coffeaeformis.AAC.62
MTVNQAIATEPPRDKQRMTEDMRQSATPGGDASSWDTEAFDAKVKTSKDAKWKGKETKKASRVQDISMCLESGHEPVKKGEESWPFESSPCKLFGGKNTKKSGDDAINKELFKTEFDIKKESKTDSEESEEDNESEISDSDNDDDDDDDDGNSFGEESEDFEMDCANYLKGTIAEETEEPKAPSPLKSEKAPKRTSKSKERLSLSRATSNRSLESTGNRSQDRSSVRRSLRRSDSDRKLTTKKSSRDDLGGSCHPNIETKNNRRGVTAKKSSQSLSAATTHGDKPSRTRTRTIQRARSNDGMETMRSSSHGGLGSSKTSHGDEGRLRSSRKLTKSSSKSGSRRGGLTRAMSTKNVKPPEQYSSSRSSSKDAEEKGEQIPKKSSRPGLERKTSQRGMDGEEKGEQTPKKSLRPGLERKSSQRSMDGEEKGEQIPKKSSRPGLERKSSQRSMRKVSEKPSRTNSKSSSRQKGDESESEVEAADPEIKRKQKSTKRGSASGDKTAHVSEAPPRRDLLVLLREQKTVQPADLMDKENRRLLHFLAFEHKMGISFKELRRSVSADA